MCAWWIFDILIAWGKTFEVDFSPDIGRQVIIVYLFCMFKANQLWSPCGTKTFGQPKQYFHIESNCAGCASTTYNPQNKLITSAQKFQAYGRTRGMDRSQNLMIKSENIETKEALPVYRLTSRVQCACEKHNVNTWPAITNHSCNYKPWMGYRWDLCTPMHAWTLDG